MSVKIAVIGGGLGGYPAAIRAARMGASVTLFEKKELGGVCLHEGCIPTKIFLQSAEIYDKVNKASSFGVDVQGCLFNFGSVVERKKSIINKLVNGIKTLIKSNNISYVREEARIMSPGKILLKGTNEVIDVDKIIISTGSVPRKLPTSVLDGTDILYSEDVLCSERIPDSIVIIGGGVIGVEFAQFYAKLGKRVTVMEMLPGILGTEDSEIAEAIKTLLEKENGVKIITGIKVNKVKRLGEKKEVVYEKGGNIQKIIVDEVVAVTGRMPQTAGLGLEEIGVKFDEKGIHVNEKMETNIREIYAAGDVTGGIMLAHVASAEGECAARNAVGVPSRISYKAVPKCIYTTPEIASVGLTEAEARKIYDVKVGKFPFYGNGKALIMNEPVGFVKIISDIKHGEILGAHIVGPQATNMISELVLAIQMEATYEEVAGSIHPHPTLSEAIMEAAMGLGEGAIHIP